jgi:flagellar rod assembly protein/muramidase FlgJ
MRQFKRVPLLLLLVASFFLTGCDADKILDVITRVAEGVQKAMPAIKEAVNTIQQAFPQNDNAPANNNTTATNTEEDANNNANVVVTSPGDEEEVSPAPANNQTTTNTTTNTTQTEAALANYRGGRLSPAEFGRLFGPAAREASKKSGVPASIILAQAALETGWGGSSIGDAKNLFGIKGTGPAGSIRVPTQEYRNGRMVNEMASFRKYNSWQESIEDHGRLLQNARYAAAMRNAGNPDQFARELQRAGYATDPEYASKLISIMKSNNFYQYNN